MKKARGFFSVARRAIAIMLVAVFCFANLPLEAFAETGWGLADYESQVLFRDGDETVTISAANSWEWWEDEGDEAPEISYAWYRDIGDYESDDPEWEQIEGETGEEIEVQAAQGTYKCVLSDANGKEEELLFYVTEDPDYNNDDDDGEENEFVDPDGSEEEIVVGEEKNVTAPAGEPNCFTFVFTPENSGNYDFYSSSEKSGVDAIGRVLIWDEENGEYIEIADDDDSGDGNHFFMSFTADKGTTYYLQARTYSIENEDITFNVALDQNKVESISFIPVDPSDTERFEYYQGIEGREYIIKNRNGFYERNFWIPGDRIVVTENGKEVTYTYKKKYPKSPSHYDVDFYDEYGHEPKYGDIEIAWDEEEWGLGENEIFITYCGKTISQLVTLHKNPVSSISYTSVEPKEYTTVEMRRNHEKGWYAYSDYVDVGDKLTVNTDKGTIVFEYTREGWIRASGDFYSPITPQKHEFSLERDKVITAGKYNFTYRVFDKEANVIVKVVQSSALEEAQYNALVELREYDDSFDEDDYYDLQYNTIDDLYSRACDDIDEASTVQEVQMILSKAKADMGAVKTKAQIDEYAATVTGIEFVPATSATDERFTLYRGEEDHGLGGYYPAVIYSHNGRDLALEIDNARMEDILAETMVAGDKFIVSTNDGATETYTLREEDYNLFFANQNGTILPVEVSLVAVDDDTIAILYCGQTADVFTVVDHPVKSVSFTPIQEYEYTQVEMYEFAYLSDNRDFYIVPFLTGDEMAVETVNGVVTYQYDGKKFVRKADSVESTLPTVITPFYDGSILGLPKYSDVQVGTYEIGGVQFFGQSAKIIVKITESDDEETELYETRNENLNALWTVYDEIYEAIERGKYRAAQELEIDKILEEGEANIYEAYRQKSKSGIVAAANTAIAALRAVKTDAQLTAEEAAKKAAEEAARKKAAEEAAKKKAAEEAAKKKAAEELKEWNGTVDKKIPVVKSPKYKTAKKSITVNWTKANKTNLKKFDTIEVQVCTNKKFAKADTKRMTVKKSKKSAVIKSLKKGKTYYVRVRNVKGKGVNKKVSKWSKVKKIKVK